MKRAVLVGLLMGLLNGGMAYAASISGKIVDEVTNLPINETTLDGYEHSNVHSRLYRYNSTNQYWDYYTAFSASTAGEFSITDLPAGQYALFADADGHEQEYYNNVKDWDKKKILVLSATRNLTLQDIKLTPYPAYIQRITQSTHRLPSTGGTVNLFVNIISGLSVTQNLKLWVISSVANGNKDADSPVTKAPLEVVLVPGSNWVTVPLTIPASYVNGDIAFYVNLGKAYGNPVSPHGFAYIGKAADPTYVVDQPAAPTTAKPVAEEIPLRIADDGTVLLKGPRPQ